MRISTRVSLALLLFFGIAGVIYAKGRRPVKRPAPPAKATPTPAKPAALPVPTPSALASMTVILVPHPDGEPQKILDFFKTHPSFRATVIFPPHYFDDPSRRGLAPLFAVLQSSRQIEVALSLDNEPVLPLLGNLGVAGNQVAKWGFNFSWPEDIAAQIARASGKYQKRWLALPSGFYPPRLNLSEAVVDTLRKFRMNWVIARPADPWGVHYFGSIAMLVPPKPPFVDELAAGSKAWADETSTWALERPFVFVDTSDLEDPKADQLFLDALERKREKLTPPRPMITAQELSETLKDEYALPKSDSAFRADYSPWVSTPQQKRAWAALADARQVIDTYQRSGHANLQRLDAAVEEMCNAESGDFLLNLSEASSANNTERPVAERNFIATLANIYRLCEVPVPANLNTWFANRTWQKSVAKPTQNEGPFFVEGPQSLTWNDPKGDDNGDGKYLYPTGAYPKGFFDLREVTISWTDTDVTITAGVLPPVAGKPLPIVPLFDAYIDVNRLADAGSTGVLRRRGNAQVTRDAAWEYALSMSPNVAVLYQAVPGSNPRVLSLQSGSAHGNSFSATFSRNVLRGDPRHWRISAGLMGTENTRRQEEPVPVSVLVNSSDKAFGGAPTGRLAPFVDLLDPSTDDQVERITANAAGGPLALPYVESQ